MEKDLSNQKQDSYSVNIQGDINGAQIQQGTINSLQFQNVNQVFDYDKVAEILNEIDKYVPMFANTYGQDCKIAENALNEAKEAVLARENPSKILFSEFSYTFNRFVNESDARWVVISSLSFCRITGIQP